MGLNFDASTGNAYACPINLDTCMLSAPRYADSNRDREGRNAMQNSAILLALYMCILEILSLISAPCKRESVMLAYFCMTADCAEEVSAFGCVHDLPAAKRPPSRVSEITLPVAPCNDAAVTFSALWRAATASRLSPHSCGWLSADRTAAAKAFPKRCKIGIGGAGFGHPPLATTC